MEITEEKIREISRIALHYLGPDANPEMLKKVVKQVVKRLQEESGS